MKDYSHEYIVRQCIRKDDSHSVDVYYVMIQISSFSMTLLCHKLSSASY